MIATVLFCSFDPIASVRRQYRQHDLEVVLGTDQAMQRTPGCWCWLLPPDQVVYQDEVQIELKPKIGSEWMLRGVRPRW